MRIRDDNPSIDMGARVQTVGDKPTIHNVIILDASGSMHGEKYNNAIKGIRKEMKVLSEDTEVDYTQTFVEFDSGYRPGSGRGLRLTTHFFMTGIKETVRAGFQPRGADGETPLYQAVGETLAKLSKHILSTEKGIVKIFTDGGENSSTGVYANPSMLTKLIRQCEDKGYTITFVGTERDVEYISRKLNIDESNTLSHNNTGAGVQDSFMSMTASTVSYAKKVLRGEDVSKGFYKKS